MKKYQILAFYCYTEIEDPHLEVKKHHQFLQSLDVRSRIYIAYNGINAQMSLAEEDTKKYTEWLLSDSRFASTLFKMDPYHEHVLPKITVKFRQQLVALDQMPNLNNRGEHVPPEKWKEMLEDRDEDTVLIDVRNDYESKIGHFEGAECPDLESFREFPKYVDELRKSKDPKKTKVMMYCTGGIRCETYSALLKEKGFDKVYQLLGGVLNYGQKMGNPHWKGKLFVFDDRLSVPLSDEPHELISCCHRCQEKIDTYYNCANMDCNELFLSCLECAEKMKGCCSQECTLAKRVRPFEKQERPKPFRKWYHYSKTKNLEDDDVECFCCGN